jgi:hypothetical protein
MSAARGRFANASELRQAAEACEEALARYYGADRIMLRLSTAAHALDMPRETVRARGPARSGRVRRSPGPRGVRGATPRGAGPTSEGSAPRTGRPIRPGGLTVDADPKANTGRRLVRRLDSPEQREREERALLEVFRGLGMVGRLDLLRRALRITRAELAEAAGLTPDRFDRLAAGAARPTLGELDCLRFALSVDAASSAARRLETAGRPGERSS